MSDTTLMIVLKFILAISLVIIALVLILAGIKSFFRGTGIQQLKDHSFEVSGLNFKLNAVVSSAGAIMLVVGSMFGFFGYSSAPTYEANLFTGLRKVAELEPAIPRDGSEVQTANGAKVVITGFKGTVALSKSWNADNYESLIKALDEPAGQGLVASYTDCLSKYPEAKVVVDYGGGYTASSLAEKPITDAWTGAFKKEGYDSNRIAVVAPSSTKSIRLAPTISIANAGAGCGTWK